MVETMHDDYISVSSAAIPLTSSGTAASTPDEPAAKLHQDKHHGHAEDVFTTMVFADIII
jgi:hypothetical protein